MNDLTIEKAIELLKENKLYAEKIKKPLSEYRIKLVKSVGLRADLQFELKKSKKKADRM
jgi:hypothetical protein